MLMGQKKAKYWYKLIYTQCPLCEEFNRLKDKRVRVYGKKPVKQEELFTVVNDWDGCGLE